jgi:hypothetical protein
VATVPAAVASAARESDDGGYPRRALVAAESEGRAELATEIGRRVLAEWRSEVFQPEAFQEAWKRKWGSASTSKLVDWLSDVAERGKSPIARIAAIRAIDDFGGGKEARLAIRPPDPEKRIAASLTVTVQQQGERDFDRWVRKNAGPVLDLKDVQVMPTHRPPEMLAEPADDEPVPIEDVLADDAL